MMDTKDLEAMKKAPVRLTGGAHPVVHAGPNRRQRRADAADAKAAKPRTMPKSIWRITSVIEGVDVGQSIRTFRLQIERGPQDDTVVVYSKEGQPPQLRGLLERMQRPGGGEAFIWTDAGAAKASIGGGYSSEAMPVEWLERRFENLSPGVAWKEPTDALPSDR